MIHSGPSVLRFRRARRTAIHRLSEDRIDGNARGRDAVLRQAEGREVRLGFIQRDKITMEHARQPHRVAVEIGDDDCMARAQPPRLLQVRDDARRHEMRADRDVRIEFLDEADELERVQPVELEPRRSVYDILPLDAQLDAAFAENRLRAILLTSFAITALLLAVVGLYGTLSYLVNLRRKLPAEWRIGNHRIR